MLLLTYRVPVGLLESNEDIQHLNLPAIAVMLQLEDMLHCLTHRVTTSLSLSIRSLRKPSSGLLAGGRPLCSQSGDCSADERYSYENENENHWGSSPPRDLVSGCCRGDTLGRSRLTPGVR